MEATATELRNYEPALEEWRLALWGRGDPWRIPVDVLRKALSTPGLPDPYRVRRIAATGLEKYGLKQGLAEENRSYPHTWVKTAEISVTTAVIRSAQALKVQVGQGTIEVLAMVTAQLALELGPEMFPRGMTLYHWNEHATLSEIASRLRDQGEPWWQLRSKSR